MKLEKILASTLLPSLPQVAVRLLEITKNPESEIGEVVETIKLDPAIAAKILKAANSSYFTFQTEISTIERAVPMLGTNVVSSLVLSFSLVDSVKSKGPLAKHFQDYWRQSIAQAAAAETIGEISNVGIQCENFLAGLLMDIGRLAMLQTIDDGSYLTVVEQAQRNPDRFLFELEQEQFGFDHTDVGAGLLEKWGLDRCLVDVARTHHLSLDNIQLMQTIPFYNLLKTAALTSSVCDYLCSQQIAMSLDRIRKLGQALFGFDEAATDGLIDRVRQRIDSVAEMFAVDVSQIGDPQELLQLANEQLVHLAIRQQASASEAAIRQQQEFEQAKQALESQNNQLQEQAFLDPLTNVYNRRFFDEFLLKEIARCRRDNAQVGVVMVDVDHFKNLNDTCGHPFGDRVLIEVANSLRESIRDADIVARYGGEEFIIIAHNATTDGLTVLSERLRRSIEALHLEFDDNAVRVTISVGAALAKAHIDDAGQLKKSLIGLADQLLYKSKQYGRNQIHVDVLTPELVKQG